MALGEEELLTVPFKVLVFIIGGLPFSALIICIVLSLFLHWDEATRTHCNVNNWLPSVSAAVASYSPERYIWRLFIGGAGTVDRSNAGSLLSSIHSPLVWYSPHREDLRPLHRSRAESGGNHRLRIEVHGTPRLALAFAFKNFLVSSPLQPLYASVTWFSWSCHLACFFNFAEIVCLLLLTSISSVDDYFLHKSSFVGFIVCGLIYMVLSTWLFDYSGRRRTSILGERSFQYKVLCSTGSMVSLVLALYFFYRHNKYCEPGIYTLFAVCEYGVVVFNILFHCTLYYDFPSRSLSLVSSTSTYQYDALPMHNNYLEKRT